MPSTPSQVRPSKSHSVLVKTARKKSSSEHDQRRPIEGPSLLTFPGNPHSHLLPISSSLKKQLTTQLDLFSVRQGTRHVPGNPSTRWHRNLQFNLIAGATWGRQGKHGAGELNLLSAKENSLESLPIHRVSRSSHRGSPSLTKLLSPAEIHPEAPVIEAKSMGNNASSMMKKDRRQQADSPETDITDDGCSAPSLLPTPNNISPLRVLLRRASASTLHLPGSSKRTGKNENSPTRLQKVPEDTPADSDSTPIVSPLPQPANYAIALPNLSLSTPTSDLASVTEAKVPGQSIPTAAPTLSPPLSSSALSPPLSVNILSRPSSVNSQTPSSIYSPFTKPRTPVTTKAPAITSIHHDCYQSHSRVFKLPNKHYPVPCMVCKVDNREQRWKCTWCCLRICTDCMESLKKIEGRALRVLVRRLEQKRENHWTAMGGQKSGGEKQGAHREARKDGGSSATIPSGDEAKQLRRLGLTRV